MTGLSLLIPSLILLVAMVTDIFTRKIYNKWVIVSIILALASSYYFFGFEGLKQGSIAAGLALIMTLPLVLAGVLGAGDMKLMFAFGLATTYSTVFSVLIFSLIWAGIVGILYAFIKGRGLELFRNTFKILTAQPRGNLKLQKIPYTVALVLAWLTFVYIGINQGALL